jgi:hypothetical protein
MTVFLLPASTNSVYFHTYLWDNVNHKPKNKVQIRFWEKAKGLYGTKFLSEDKMKWNKKFEYPKPSRDGRGTTTL